MGQGKTPSSGTLYFFAVLFWIIAWWLIELGVNDAVTRAVGVFLSMIGLAHAMGAVNQAVPTPSPFKRTPVYILWALRPRGWVIAWAAIFLALWLFGKPMVLWNYGGGRCEYVDWWLEVLVLRSHGDGAFDGCRVITATPLRRD